ncbi:hypothetical protein RZS08_42965, partial [Arthrospira platensis SPKY1]|nr:hypothetical protein [Arthrospira platensis SPKY1]
MFKHHFAFAFLALTLLLSGIVSSCKKTDETIPSLLLAETISIEEGNNGNQLVRIQITLSSKSSSNVVLTYSTSD